MYSDPSQWAKKGFRKHCEHTIWNTHKKLYEYKQKKPKDCKHSSADVRINKTTHTIAFDKNGRGFNVRSIEMEKNELRDDEAIDQNILWAQLRKSLRRENQ